MFCHNEYQIRDVSIQPVCVLKKLPIMSRVECLGINDCVTRRTGPPCPQPGSREFKIHWAHFFRVFQPRGLFVLIKHFGAHSCAAQPHNEILSYFENERILDLFIDAGINFRSEGHLMSVENVNKMISWNEPKLWRKTKWTFLGYFEINDPFTTRKNYFLMWWWCYFAQWFNWLKMIFLKLLVWIVTIWIQIPLFLSLLAGKAWILPNYRQFCHKFNQLQK